MKNKSGWKFTISLGVWLLGIAIYAQAQSPYQVKIGDIQVTALTDGAVPVDVDKLFPATASKKPSQLLEGYFLKNPVEISINAFLIQDGAKLILADAGSGELMGKYGGLLVQQLQKAGFQPENITDILITHVHADHSGGLVVNGKKVFPNAVIHVHQAEIDFWLNDANKQKADPNRMGADPQTFTNAKNMLTPYLQDNKVAAFTKETTVLTHITAIPYPGHTPGHTIYVLNSKNESLYFWGDMVHVPDLQFATPALADNFDVDIPATQEKRKTFYEKAAVKKYLIAAPHASFPGIGHLKKEGAAYRWVPVPFSIEGRTE